MGGSARPTFAVTSETQHLGIDQRQGISGDVAAEQMTIYHRNHDRQPPSVVSRLRGLVRRIWTGDRGCRLDS
jgi:hypothetical protein